MAFNSFSVEKFHESGLCKPTLSKQAVETVTKERELVLQSMTRLGFVLRLLHSCTHTTASSFPWKGLPLFLQCGFWDLIIHQWAFIPFFWKCVGVCPSLSLLVILTVKFIPVFLFYWGLWKKKKTTVASMLYFVPDYNIVQFYYKEKFQIIQKKYI